MKTSKLYFILIIAYFGFITSGDCNSKEIETKFIEAGLINVHEVDETIKNDKEIDMGFTPFYKSTLSIYWGYAKLKMFDLSEAQKQNRKLLSNVMKKAGFIPLSYEWWHFNGMTKDDARKKYLIIE